MGKLTAYSAHFDTNGGDRHRNIIRAAERVKSMIYCRSTEHGPLGIADTGCLYRITVMFVDEQDLMWFKLKWA